VFCGPNPATHCVRDRVIEARDGRSRLIWLRIWHSGFLLTGHLADVGYGTYDQWVNRCGMIRQKCR
jgi:hypothetical protein